MTEIREGNPPIRKIQKFPPDKQELAYQRAIRNNPLCELCEFNDQEFKPNGKVLSTYCSIYGKILRRIPIYGFHENCKSYSKKRGKKNDNQTQ